jgi:hypothetical protein
MTFVIAVGAAALLSILASTACDSVDPSVQLFTIHFRNNLGEQVLIHECDDTRCRKLSDSWAVSAGSLTDDTISDRAVTTAWLVTKTNRMARLGCITLRFDGRYNDIVVRLSQLQPCATARPLPINQVHHGSHQSGPT